MRLLIIAVLLFMFAVFTVRGAKLTNTTSVDSAKTGGQIILCDWKASTEKVILITKRGSGRQAKINPSTVIKIGLAIHRRCYI